MAQRRRLFVGVISFSPFRHTAISPTERNRTRHERDGPRHERTRICVLLLLAGSTWPIFTATPSVFLPLLLGKLASASCPLRMVMESHLRGRHLCERVVLEPDHATVRARVLLLLVAKRAFLVATRGSNSDGGTSNGNGGTPTRITIASMPGELIEMVASHVPVTYQPSAVWHACPKLEWLLSSPSAWGEHVDKKQKRSPEAAEQPPDDLTNWSQGNAFLTGDRIPGPLCSFASYALVNPNTWISDMVPNALECMRTGWPKEAIDRLSPPRGCSAHAYLHELLAVDWDEPVSIRASSYSRRDVVGIESVNHLQALGHQLEAAGVSPAQVRILFQFY